MKIKAVIKKIFLTSNRQRFLFIVIPLFLWLSLITAVKSAQAEFPPSLPTLPDQLGATTNNTPEYVIIKPSDQVTFSSETAASVASINVKEGSAFHSGDILLTLDCRLQEAELNKALAQSDSAKMASDSAKKLKTYGSISDFELVKATSEADMAQAEVDKLKAIVEKCVIKAPFNGSVADIMVHAHETVKTGDPLLKIVGTENLEFEMQVPSCWLTWLHVGTSFSVHINETDKMISAKITDVDPQIEPVSQSVKVVSAITPDDASLLPGMSGQAIFPGSPQMKCSRGAK